MPQLTFDQLLSRRIREKNPDLREFIEKADNVRRTLPHGYDRDEGMVIELRILLHGGKTLKGAHSESMTKLADLAVMNAPNHPDTRRVQQIAHDMSAYHYSRMR